MTSKKFYETPAFKKLNAEWRLKLYESGHEDIETAGENGPLRNDAADNFEVFTPWTPEILDQCAEESIDVRESVWGIGERARDALDNPEIWEGLPENARKWWGLVVLAGWSGKRAREHLGIGHNDVTDKWRKLILERL